MSISMKEIIEQKIQEALDPVSVEVINESHLHKGHRGDDGSGESHFKLKVVSSAFEGKSRLARHKIVFEILSEQVQQIHALSIDADVPK